MVLFKEEVFLGNIYAATKPTLPSPTHKQVSQPKKTPCIFQALKQASLESFLEKELLLGTEECTP